MITKKFKNNQRRQIKEDNSVYIGCLELFSLTRFLFADFSSILISKSSQDETREREKKNLSTKYFYCRLIGNYSCRTFSLLLISNDDDEEREREEKKNILFFWLDDYLIKQSLIYIFDGKNVRE